MPGSGWRWFGLLLGAICAACGSDTDPRRVPPFPDDYEPRAAGSLTFGDPVARIVHENCSSCHHPGQAAPFSLITFEQVRKRADQIARVTADSYMPPWLPEPGYGEFVGERRLSVDQIGILNQWAREGAAPGDLARAPAPPEFVEGWFLGQPDLVVSMPEAYSLKADAGDVFRNFVLPVPLDRKAYVRSIEFRPDNLLAMHHATIAVDRTPRSRYHDDLDDQPGFDGMINANAQRPDGHLLGWVPGKLPFEGRDDIAWQLEPGADLVVQLHMRASGKPEQVRASIGLYFAEQAPTRTPFLLRLGSWVLDIPPGESDYEIRDTYVLPIDVHVLGLVPHAHYIAREMEGYADLPDGERTWLFRIPEWDFNWQDEYRFVEPVFLPKGSALTMRFTYDNSSGNPRNPNQPPQRVRWGPDTSDEMGDLWLQVLPLHDEQLELLRQDFGRRDLRAQIEGSRAYLVHTPDDQATRHALAEMLQAAGRPDEAIDQYREIIGSRPDHALAHNNLGGALLTRGELEQAVRHYRSAIRLEPEIPELHFNLGQALKRQGEIDGAAAAYQRALELQPGLARAHFALGNIFMSRRQLDRAEDEFRAAIRLDDGNVQAHNNIGTLLGIAGHLDQAIAEFRRAIELRPDHAKSHFNLGLALAQAGQADAAIAEFRSTLALQPNHPRARQALKTALQPSSSILPNLK